MKAVTLIFVLFFAAALAANAKPKDGNYRQCNVDNGDETLLDINGNSAKALFIFGGCLGVNTYEIDMAFDIEYQDQRDDGGYNVKYSYSHAKVTPHTLGAVSALENTCGNNKNFEIGKSTDVLNCLFCGGTRYDILLYDEKYGVILGDGIACSSSERPIQYDESWYAPVDINDYINFIDGSSNGGSSGDSSDASVILPSILSLLAVFAFLF